MRSFCQSLHSPRSARLGSRTTVETAVDLILDLAEERAKGPRSLLCQLASLVGQLGTAFSKRLALSHRIPLFQQDSQSLGQLIQLIPRPLSFTLLRSRLSLSTIRSHRSHRRYPTAARYVRAVGEVSRRHGAGKLTGVILRREVASKLGVAVKLGLV